MSNYLVRLVLVFSTCCFSIPTPLHLSYAQADDGVLSRLDAISMRLKKLEQPVAPEKLDWIRASVSDGWKAYGDASGAWSSGYTPFHYTKTKTGLVILTGMMSGCANRNSPVFTLPENFRPARTHIFTPAALVGGKVGIAHVYVQPNGQIMFFEIYTMANCDKNNITSNWLSLSGVSFPNKASILAGGK